MMNAKDIATTWMTCQVTGDGAGFLGMLHDDLSWTIHGTTRFSGRRNKPEMLKLIAEELAPVMSVSLTIENVFGAGNHAAVQASAVGRGPTGAYNQNYCFILKIADDKIIDVAEYCDTVMIETAVCGHKLVAA